MLTNSFKPCLLIISTLPILYTSCSEIDKQLEISENRDMEEEVMKLADEQSKLTPKEREAIRLKSELEQKRIDEKHQQIMAQKKAQEKAKADLKRETQLLALQIEQEKAKAEKEAEAKLQAEIEELNRKREEQRIAGANYVGTKYEKLKLKNGKTLINAKATEVCPSHVTYIHSTGIANVKFKDLKHSIRTACKYDPELAEHSRKKQAELQRRIKSRLAAEKLNDIKKHQQKTKKQIKSTASKYSKPSKPNYGNIVPKGKVSARTVRVTNNGSYRAHDTRKMIEVKAISNVPATLNINGINYKVTPNVPTVQTVSVAFGKYTAILRDDNGRILDQESHNRKTGL